MENNANTTKGYNSLFSGLIGLWLLGTGISLFTETFMYLPYIGDDAESLTLFIAGIVCKILLITGIAFIFKYKKEGVFMIAVSAVTNFLTLTILQGLITGIIGCLGFVLFFSLFFLLDKDGVTAYRTLFPKE